jgi:hypothetical protein
MGNLVSDLGIHSIEEAIRSASEMKRKGWDGSLSSANFFQLNELNCRGGFISRPVGTLLVPGCGNPHPSAFTQTDCGSTSIRYGALRFHCRAPQFVSPLYQHERSSGFAARPFARLAKYFTSSCVIVQLRQAARTTRMNRCATCCPDCLQNWPIERVLRSYIA